MAECYDQEQEDRYRLLRGRLATAYRPAHRPDDDEDLPPPPVAASSAAAASSAGAAHLFGGSFQFIVQEQAKSMVAIQELQQEVGSLLLFRQAVLAALPHLHQQQQQQPSNALLLAQGNNSTKIIAAANTSAATTATTNTIIGGQSWTRRKQQHLQQQQLTGGGGYRSLQDGSSDQPAASTAITSSTSSNNPVVDSGFSTEASNSNTSPRSSRFDTTSSSEMTMSHHHQQQQPMEKELLQHLERVQQRLARLKKDEDRLLTLLNLKRMANATAGGGTANDDDDELWILLEEIQLRSQAMRNSSAATEAKDAVNKPEEAVHQQQSLSHKKRVSFQQQQQQLLETEGRVVVASDSVDVLPSPAGKLSCSTLSSSSSSRYQPPSRDQVATILRLTNPVQLQRHLLRALLDNQTLREQVESGRCDVESRDVQWRTKNQLAVEQMTALRDENEDLRFQLEEQKIELEGTKARLRMLNRVPSPSPHHHGAPAVTSVRVRATSTQTDRPTTLLLHHSPLPAKAVHQCCSQGTQTTVAELLAEDNNNKVVVVGGGRALPRVVDASPKPQKLVSKLVDLAHGNGAKVNGSGSSWGDPDEERPSVEGGRRSYSSRIPTPIKPTVIPTPAVVSVNNYNNNNSSSKMVSAVAATTTTPSKRELPDIPMTNKMMTKSPLGVVTPVGTKIYQQRGSKSDPANAVATTKVRLPVGSSHKLRTRLALTDSLSSSEDQQQQQQQHHSDHHKVDDYYDSINANNKNRGSPMYQVQQHHSPVDSLERSLPSVGIPYNYQRRVAVTQQRDNRSYNSQSSAGSSTTPSNSLSFHHP
ncbi:hypothetical protein GHT06_020053 [Daphnia sinensis]|uniref:Uncharacterized protein n=1 Tax=Daphnia sinensis TaxID=1820382 RepID=A0AAD5PP58_9CRUS|nr:hypothetical protein GHT06_020053 [Daphnia sinensis]